MTSDRYYTPPEAWSYEQIRINYLRLASSYKVAKPLPFEHEGQDLSKLKQALGEISLGIKSQDPACLQLAVDFVTAPVYFHYSGYLRAGMARRLKQIPLPASHAQRLQSGLLKLFRTGKFGPEYLSFVALLRQIGLGDLEPDYKALSQAGGKQALVARALFSP
jgi:hypothetical protein